METKYCKRCDQTLSVDKFTKSSGRYDGLQAYCSECMKLYRREHYYKNKQPYLDRAKKNNLIYFAKIQRWIADYKDDVGCELCGVKYPGEPWLLEFDHKDGTNKINSVSRLARGSLKRVKEEMEKCELLCVVCHRRRTAKQFGWGPVDNAVAE